MEYLQKQNAQNILHFWLAAETFCLSCRDKSYYKSRLKKQKCLYNVSQNNSNPNIGNVTINDSDSGNKNLAWNRNPGYNSEDKSFGNHESPSIGKKEVKNHYSLDSSNNFSSVPGERLRSFPNKFEGSATVDNCSHSVNENDNCNSSDVHNKRLQEDVRTDTTCINNHSKSEVEMKPARLKASSNKDESHHHLKCKFTFFVQ